MVNRIARTAVRRAGGQSIGALGENELTQRRDTVDVRQGTIPASSEHVTEPCVGTQTRDDWSGSDTTATASKAWNDLIIIFPKIIQKTSIIHQ